MRAAAAAASLVLAVVIVYHNALAAYFFDDDFQWLVLKADPTEIGALFGCLSVLWFLRWRQEGESRFRALSVAAFALALLTHESSVVFLPVIILANMLSLWRVRKDPPSTTESRVDIVQGGADLSGPRTFTPYVALTVLYLSIDLWINSRNYVISQGHYAIGLHVFTNALDYIDALYVGRRDALNYTVIVIGVTALLVRGNARVTFAICWMLLGLAPFLLFNWGNTSRYLYQPAIGFSMLLAEGVMRLHRPPASGVDHRVRSGFSRTMLIIVVAAIAIRFGLFAYANVRDFAVRTHVYPEYLARFRDVHGNVPSNTVIASDPRVATKLPYQFVNAAVQWEYRDATIQIAPYESNGVH